MYRRNSIWLVVLLLGCTNETQVTAVDAGVCPSDPCESFACPLVDGGAVENHRRDYTSCSCSCVVPWGHNGTQTD